jgi:hypothetical protein
MRVAGILLAFVFSTFAGGARGADAPATYAVVSLVGDSITIVTYEGVTGTNLDRNEKQQVALGDGVFDKLATRVALNTLHRSLPDAGFQAIDVAEPTSFGDATELFAADGRLPALLAAVRPQLKASDTHYLVVISKFRSEARLRTSNSHIGSGKLAGLGFYVDPVKRMKRGDTGERGRGFVAPFAYVEVDLVDLQTGAVVRSENAKESITRANAGPDATLDPWDALTPEQKVRLLENLLGRAVQKTVSQVVAPT